jgi:GT2 family glycosyltransferase
VARPALHLGPSTGSLVADTLPTAVLPIVSVVVPTHNRASSLGDMLAALLAQRYPADRLEVIVVDDGSTDATPEVVRAAQARTPFPIHYYRTECGGAAAARNFGVARARGEVLAFTDSDCHPISDWLGNAIAYLVGNIGLVSGPVRPFVHPRRIPGFFSHQIDHQRENALYPTANVLYRREAFVAAGGFDTGFDGRFGRAPAGEDTDLGWRVRRAGYGAAWAANAPVDHEASGVSARRWLLAPRQAECMPFLVAAIPELRRESLYLGFFMDRHNPAFYLGLTGACIAVARRRPLALLLALPFLWQVRGWVTRDLWTPMRWWRIPLKYGLVLERYALQTAALLYGSVRHRCLVL